ncbi:tetratricopeptide repeat protein [bacterium]|nr:tetratricopeptide repeat protein [bacterium]
MLFILVCATLSPAHTRVSRTDYLYFQINLQKKTDPLSARELAREFLQTVDREGILEPRTDEVAKSFATLSISTGDTGIDFLSVADSLFHNGNFAYALGCYTTFGELDGYSPPLFYNIALCLFKLGLNKDAEQYINKALKSRDALPDYSILAARIKEQTGDFSSARKIIKKAKKRFKELPLTQRLLNNLEANMFVKEAILSGNPSKFDKAFSLYRSFYDVPHAPEGSFVLDAELFSVRGPDTDGAITFGLDLINRGDRNLIVWNIHFITVLSDGQRIPCGDIDIDEITDILGTAFLPPEKEIFSPEFAFVIDTDTTKQLLNTDFALRNYNLLLEVEYIAEGETSITTRSMPKYSVKTPELADSLFLVAYSAFGISPRDKIAKYMEDFFSSARKEDTIPNFPLDVKGIPQDKLHLIVENLLLFDSLYCAGEYDSLPVIAQRLAPYREAISDYSMLEAISYQLTGEYDSAYTILKSREDFWGYFNIGLIYFGAERIGDAMRSFKQAEKILPENPEVHLNLGIIYERLDEPELAVEEYRKYLNLGGRRVKEVKGWIKSIEQPSVP